MKRSAVEVSSSSPVKAGKAQKSSPTPSKKNNETVIRLRPIVKFCNLDDENPAKQVLAVQVHNAFFQKELFQAMQGGGIVAKLLFKADEEERQRKIMGIFREGITDESMRVKNILFY